MRGYVYVLTNKAMPGLVKIGRSKNGGAKRASELYTTGVPAPFEVAFEVLADDCVEVERSAHQALQSLREPGREFFKCDVWAAKEAILNAVAEEIDSNVIRFEFSDLSRIGEVAHVTDTPMPIVFDAMFYIPNSVWADAIRDREAEISKRKER